MTEVPEHLLKRSRDRRAALGLGGDDGGGGEDAPAAAAPAESAGSGVAAATPTAAAPAAAATPAVAPEPEPVPPYVEAAVRRKKIPIWAMPVLAFLPVWAILFLGGLSKASTGEPTQLEQGATIFAAQCASCHGAGGGGGVGRPMTDGNLVKTFPDILGQLEFVALGSAGTGPDGTPYGDPAREGGQHTTYSWNGNAMPAFGKTLTNAELLAVVRYEQEVLSGRVLDPTMVDSAGNLLYANGEPMLDSSGQLVTPDGAPLFDADLKLTIQPNWTNPVGGE